ncbi:GFA family protein [Phycicoccus sonneratiae]|uniref:GFA family protein n=1 Tax=Phycicoccus sonneratiae TaxID=2807628 RepID=A0ABS2CLT9_9MICO|nr:GFA family protein [Phycicoccus sonneraticus]MBM6400755.1 GFA family protein [Phycicoccus sonneraticus]
MHAGGCACGAVRYEATGALRDVVDCHCDRCRRVTGHFLAATSTADDDLAVSGDEALRWWEAAPGVRYGFCATCGSTLFWRVDGSGRTSLAAGTLDPPTGLRTTSAWYVADASDYHRLDDTLEQRDHE